MIIPFVIFAAVVLLFLVGILFYLFPSRERISTIPGPDPSSERDGNIPDITKAGSLPDFLEQLHEEFGDIASFWMGKEFVVSIGSPELFKEHGHVFDRPASVFEFVKPLIGELSIQYANGGAGKERRQLHDRSFSHDKVMKGLPLLQEIGDKMASKWSKVNPEEHIALGSDMHIMALESIARFSFGDYFKNEKQLLDFRKDYDMCFDIMETMLTEGTRFEPGSDTTKQFRKSLDSLSNISKDMLKQREASEIAPEDKIFIDSLIDKYDNEDMIFSDIISYLIGGSHTTAFSMTWAFYFLASHQEMQDKLAGEIQSVCKGGQIQPEHIKKMKYLNQVMYETLRCARLAPFGARVQSFETSLGGHKIPSNTPVIHALGVVSGSEKYFPEPNKFDPDRFAEGNSIPPYAFSPFGFAGKRKCPGYRLSEAEIAVFLACLIPKFKILLVPGQVVTRKYGLVTKPTEEIWVTLQARK